MRRGPVNGLDPPSPEEQEDSEGEKEGWQGCANLLLTPQSSVSKGHGFARLWC